MSQTVQTFSIFPPPLLKTTDGEVWQGVITEWSGMKYVEAFIIVNRKRVKKLATTLETAVLKGYLPPEAREWPSTQLPDNFWLEDVS